MTAPTITRLKLPAVRRWISSTPWAIQPETGQRLLAYLEERATGEAPPIAAADTRTRSADNRTVTKSGGMIAVLPLYGVIAQRMDMMMAFCGGTSAERFADDFDAAMADPNVSAIVIDCDSPGGNVQGTPELAKRIFAARGKGKQLIAVSNGQMCSAAYWICAACDEVVASPSSETGSIGVFCVHLDESGFNEQLGLKYTIIKFGEHKAEGNPWEPLPADAEAFIQGQVDEMGGMFHASIAKYRGVSVAKVKSDFGQGRSLTARQALEAGLVDRIATIEETLNRLGARDVGMSGRPKRALGASAATFDESGTGIPVAPVLVGTGLERSADDTAPETVPAEDQPCPQCGEPLDDSGNCTACDYQSASADTTTENDTSARADGATPRASDSPEQRPHEAKEETAMTTAAAPGGAPDLIAAERQRASTIRKLGQKHRSTDDAIEAMISEGLTIDQAATRILGDVEARGAAAPNIRVGADREAERPFANVGEQLMAIVQSGKPGARRDARLVHVNAQALRFEAGAPSGMNESTGSEGGFYIQNDLLPGVITPIYQEDPILSRVKRIPIGGDKNGVKYNVVDETSRADGSRYGGIQAYWVDEADTATAKKPKLRRVEMELKKILGIAYLTNELTTDAPAAQSLLLEAFQNELRFMLASAVFRGTGVGQPLGFLNSGAFVKQAIEASQTIANTPASIYLNVTKMLSHIPAALWGDVIWLYNPELLPYLMGATVASSSIPVFVPFAGFGDQASVDRVLGRPAFASDQCEAVGTPGDLVAVAPSQYHMIEKGGASAATSVEVRFLYDELTLRITYRVDGQPVWVTTVTPYKGSAARTAFVGLNTRS